MIDNIVTCTNLALQRKRDGQSYSRKRDINSTSVTEIRAVVGILLLLRTKKCGRTNVIDIWTKDGTGIMKVRACMSYRRFLLLLKFLDLMTKQQEKREEILINLRPCENSWMNSLKIAEISIILVPTSQLMKSWNHFGGDALLYNIYRVNQPDMVSKFLHCVMPRVFSPAIWESIVDYNQKEIFGARTHQVIFY